MPYASLLLGAAAAAVMFSTGWLCLRASRFPANPLALGLAPSIGLAVLAVGTTWASATGLPETILGALIVALSSAGIAAVLRDWLRSSRIEGKTAALLALALAIPAVILAHSYGIRVGIPDYAHDGAHHTETIDALRQGVHLVDYAWYPNGFHAPAAALLALLPNVDSATGAVAWAVGVTLSAPLAAFALGFSLWRDTRPAAAGALMLALSSAYPYGPHLYSVWPMAAALLFAAGLWVAALEYLERRSIGLTIVAGVLLAATLLTHGTELITEGIGMCVMLVVYARRVRFQRALPDMATALVCALALVTPYISALRDWVVSGGAVGVGTPYFDSLHSAVRIDLLGELVFWSSSLSSGYVVDAPARLLMIGLAAMTALRCRGGRWLLALAGLFVVLVAMARYMENDIAREIFALTLPWAVADRLVMIVAILLAPLAGLGSIQISRYVSDRVRLFGPDLERGIRSWQRVARLGGVVVVAGVLASVFLVATMLSHETASLITYSEDDAAALRWLSAQLQPGDIVMNDGTADAGIWAPYKAGAQIVLPRTRVAPNTAPESLVRTNLAMLDSRADVRQAACDLKIHYIYRGAANGAAEVRQFPRLDVLDHSAALEDVYRSGGAAVFRTKLDCPG